MALLSNRSLTAVLNFFATFNWRSRAIALLQATPTSKPDTEDAQYEAGDCKGGLEDDTTSSPSQKYKLEKDVLGSYKGFKTGSHIEINTRNSFQRLTFTWLSDLISLGKLKPLEQEDLYSLHSSEKCDQMAIKFQAYWDHLNAHFKNPQYTKKPVLLWYLLTICWWDIMWAGLGYVFITTSTLITSFYVGLMIGNVKSSSAELQGIHAEFPPEKSTISIAMALFFIQMCKIIFSALCNSHYWKIVQRIPTILTSAVYEKSFRLSLKSKKKYSNANILNIVNQDIDMIKGGSDFFLGIFAPFEILANCYFLWRLLGTAFISSLLIVTVVVGGTTWFAKMTAHFMMMWRKSADGRIGAIRELIQGMKIVKLLSLESMFYDKIHAARTTQLNHLYSYWSYNAGMRALSLSASTLIAVVSFAVYQGIFGNVMTADIVFPALMLFDMSEAFRMLGYSANVATQAWLGIEHIDGFLSSPEEEKTQANDHNLDTAAITVVNGVWEYEDVVDSGVPGKWSSIPGSVTTQYQSLSEVESSKTFQLDIGSIRIPKGAFVGVCGSVGAGKSTFLNSLLGEVTKVRGESTINGRIAYCSQDPWIMKGTILDNIVFGAPFSESRLDRAIQVCGLSFDISNFPFGVQTQIGESGVNLSGGQKSRVSLARAIYSDADIYLLDDPLSSSDAAVGAAAMKLLLEELKGKTVCLVTHSMEQLSQLEWILAVDQGKVVEFGFYKEIIKKRECVVMRLMREDQKYMNSKKRRSSTSGSAAKQKESSSDSYCTAADSTEFIVNEDKEIGGFRLELYKRSITPVRPLLPVLMGLFIWCIVSSIMSPLWLVHWTSSETTDPFFVYMYIFLGLSVVVSNICLYCAFALSGVRIAEFFHDEALCGLLKTTMTFFDTNPVGRIINRMTGDVTGLDTSIAHSFSSVAFSIVNCISVLIIVCGNSFSLIILFALIFYLSFSVFKYYRYTFLEVRRISSVLKSPLDAHVNETLNGMSIIKAFGKEAVFTRKLRESVDRSEAANYIYHSVILWFEQRLGLLSSTVFISIALIGCIPNASKDYAALIGVSLTYSSSLTDAIERLLTNMGLGEASMNSIERLNKYAVGLPVEGPAELSTDPKKNEWPLYGAISVSNLSIAYEQRPDYDVIKNISFHIFPGENIGICGRSGCGKSTLVSSLFRLIERRKGSIVIDGLDIAQVGLKTLRSRIHIIPQDPILFEGTVRSNLGIDYCDQELWDALDHCGLKDYVSEQERKLDAPVSVKGSNFSFGQRQLLCLGRAMLSKPKVLILDESTSSIDGASDERINYIIKNHFKSTTILSIAHRLDSIADFDRIMLIDDGKLEEFDTPSFLLSKPLSKFSQLVASAGY